MPRHIGTCFRFYTQMRMEKKTKAFAYRIYSHFTKQCSPLSAYPFFGLHARTLLTRPDVGMQWYTRGRNFRPKMKVFSLRPSVSAAEYKGWIWPNVKFQNFFIYIWRRRKFKYKKFQKIPLMKNSWNPGILLPKLFWPTMRKNCSSDWEKLLKFEA